MARLDSAWPAALAATVWWSYVLLGRTSNWFPSLRPFVLVVGIPRRRRHPRSAPASLGAEAGRRRWSRCSAWAPHWRRLSSRPWRPRPRRTAAPSPRSPRRRRAASGDPGADSPVAAFAGPSAVGSPARPSGRRLSAGHRRLPRRRLPAAASPGSAAGTGTNGGTGDQWRHRALESPGRAEAPLRRSAARSGAPSVVAAGGGGFLNSSPPTRR